MALEQEDRKEAHCPRAEGSGQEAGGGGTPAPLELVKWQGSPNHDHYQYDDDHVPDYYSQLRFDERNSVGAGLPTESIDQGLVSDAPENSGL